MSTSEILAYHQKLNTEESAICGYLSQLIHQALPTAIGKIWHGHPVWFIDENPTVSYKNLRRFSGIIKTLLNAKEGWKG